MNKYKLKIEIITFCKIMNIFPFNKFIGASSYIVNYKCIDKLLQLRICGYVDLAINFSNIKVNNEKIGIKLYEFDSNNCEIYHIH